MIPEGFVTSAYILSGVLFILSLNGLSHQETARKGNLFGILGMCLAIGATLLSQENLFNQLTHFAVPLILGALIGTLLAARVAMTAMPELVAILHSFVGLAAVFVGFSNFLTPPSSAGSEVIHLIEVYLAIFIGAMTFTGSVVAYGKLKGSITGKPLLIPARHAVNLVMVAICFFLLIKFIDQGYGEDGLSSLFVMTAIASILGIHMVLAIGGADMPVVVSMLNSYSGWAAAAAGFMLSNDLLIITGALVGSSGAILSYIMCRAMNRSFLSVILGGFGTAGSSSSGTSQSDTSVTEFSIDETVEALNQSQNIVIVPGYGMAVAQAQHSLSQIIKYLREQGTQIHFAIHPVAGRLPGHMNVLLAEANVPYDIVLEMDEINDDLKETDLVLVIGANDIVNPSAMEDEASPIAGMPVLEVWQAQTVVVFKRGLGTGYAGIDNSLFYKENTRMLFGDAKKNIDAIFSKVNKA